MSEDACILSLDRSSLADEPFLSKSLLDLPLISARTNLPASVQRVARRGWEERARFEYIGVMVVRRFHGLLIDVNAPLDLQELALKMMLQEQQHASLCMTAARSLGSNGELSFDLEELQQARDDRPVEEQLFDMIVRTYGIGEVVALELIKHSIDVLPPSIYRDILRQIARDEVLHARIGLDILRALRAEPTDGWLEYPGDEWIQKTAESSIETMRKRDVVEDDEAELFRDPEARAQLMSLGIPPSDDFKLRYQHALGHEVPARFRDVGVSLARAT